MKKLRGILRGWLLEMVHQIRLRTTLWNVERRNPILVYQMGKVGSSSVVRTLERLHLNRPILHVHTLNSDHLAQAIQKQRASSSPYLPEHLITSSILVNKLRQDIFPCQVITLTREPVTRAISFVFEDWQKKAPQARQVDRLDAVAMTQAVTNMLEADNGHADPGRWFERELHACFGIDVFGTPYDTDQGFTIVRKEPVSALVMRMEDLDRALARGLAALLDVDPSQIAHERANTGRKKWYAEALRTVKDTYRLSDERTEEIYSTRYMRHFYDREVLQLQQRWTQAKEKSSS